MITSAHLVPGQVLRASRSVRIIDDRSPLGFYDDWVDAYCMVIGSGPLLRHRVRKTTFGLTRRDDWWPVLVFWFDGRCQPRIEHVHVSPKNDWDVGW